MIDPESRAAGAQRDRLFAEHGAPSPDLAGYHDRITRVIPVVVEEVTGSGPGAGK